jgi:mannose-6-phosphate isomerase-like protein (cupin superfamily)
MAELERERVREREAPQEGGYEKCYTYREDFQDRQKTGKIVIRSDEREWEISRQGRLKWYLHPQMFSDTCLRDWYTFLHDIRTHSGKHRHQGGLAIFVIEGKGYTTVDGERLDWEEGDLILLPLKPNGVEHQHFNREPGKPCKWLAFINNNIWDYGASELTQVELSPEYKG